MNNVKCTAEDRIREGFERRMAALRTWRYDAPGSNMCPCCFGTWISVLFTEGWEHLRCCECGAEGPLPEQVRMRKLERAPAAQAKRPIRAQKPVRTPLRKQCRNHVLNVAW